MKSSQLYNTFLLNILHKLVHNSSDSFTVSFININNSEMLEIFCDSLLSFHFFGYKYIGNKYYKVHNGLIFSYTVDHGKKIITFKCDLKKEISELDLITKKLYLNRILFNSN